MVELLGVATFEESICAIDSIAIMSSNNKKDVFFIDLDLIYIRIYYM